MICSVCKKEIEDNARVCPFCGADLGSTTVEIIELSFKKPAPPPVIELTFVEPIEEEYVEELEPVAEEPEAEIEPLVVAPVINRRPAPPRNVNLKKKQKNPKKQKKPKKTDKINFFCLLLSLLWAPYPGIFLWISKSKKTPKASQAYGICAIVMYLLKCLKRVIISIITKVLLTVMFIVFVGGITAVLFMIQFGYMPMPI